VPHPHNQSWTRNAAESSCTRPGLTRRRRAPRASVQRPHDHGRMRNAVESSRSCPGLTRRRRAPQASVPHPHGRCWTPIPAGSSRSTCPGLTRRRRAPRASVPHPHDPKQMRNAAESSHPCSGLTHRRRTPRASVPHPHVPPASTSKSDAKALIRYQNFENSHHLGTQWPRSLQCHVGRKERHSVRAFHAVEMALRLFRIAAMGTVLMDHVSRARWKDMVSSRQKAGLSLPSRLVTRPQTEHA